MIFLTSCTTTEATPTSYFGPSTPPMSSPQPKAATAAPNQMEATLVSDSGGNGSQVKEAGELYFFLQPRQAGPPIQLAKVSGLCVVDPAQCPTLQIVNVPFAFNFTINALSWSPDGRFAAFSYADNPSGTPTKLWLFDAAAVTWTSLAEFPYIDPPFWSPDNAWIAFRTQDGLGNELVHVIHSDGTELKNIGANLPAEGRPYIMDGWFTENVIMRSALPGSLVGPYLVNAGDGSVRPMFEKPLVKGQFIVSPDASLFVYDEIDAGGQNHTLKAISSDGINVTTLANISGGRLYPIVWSPNSQWVAFNHYSGLAEGMVYVAKRDGSVVFPVYKGSTIGRLLFSPNGKYLLVEETTSATGGHLFLINLATLETKILQAPGLSTDYDWYAPSWRPSPP